ncbi:MAG: CoA transferase [Dehalococcoidia bacterium]|nr:CoA transferase [Dehalococcoidia bacterium]
MNRLPLSGVRVADFSWIIAGPTATRHLALMGADVIKVGSARRPDPSTRGSAFHVYNQSKKYTALNLSQQRGKDLALDLVAQCDVVVENYAAGVFERLGLGYDVLSEVRPDIVMIASSGTGHTGPDRDYVAYGSLLQHYTGWNSISGYPDSEPIKGGLWADPWVGMELAMITVAALNHRLETGTGQYVDFSMAEALSASLPEALLDYQMNGIEPVPVGNRDRNLAPHSVYRCAGDDRWIAVEVHTSEQWHSLCEVIGRADLVSDSNLDTPEGRKAREDEIDRAIGAWTSEIDDEEAFHLLQRAGVPCGLSLDMGRLHAEPQLNEGGYLTSIEYPDGAERVLPTLPWRFDGSPDFQLGPAPELGHDSAYMYSELLGLSDADIEALIEERVIY